MKLSEVEKVLAAAKAKAGEMGLAVSIAVVDQRGDLVALARLDGARHFTPDLARGKAIVSATFGIASGVAAEGADTSPIMQTINRLSLDRMVYWQGAVPLLDGDQLVGAVGVSGAASDQDEEIATAGAGAL